MAILLPAVSALPGCAAARAPEAQHVQLATATHPCRPAGADSPIAVIDRSGALLKQVQQGMPAAFRPVVARPSPQQMTVDFDARTALFQDAVVGYLVCPPCPVRLLIGARAEAAGVMTDWTLYYTGREPMAPFWVEFWEESPEMFQELTQSGARRIEKIVDENPSGRAAAR
jgi:hypothetical protein